MRLGCHGSGALRAAPRPSPRASALHARARLLGLVAALAGASAPLALAQDHLLLSEVALAPSPGELIEVANPTPLPVALDLVHLADTQAYALLAGASGGGPAPQVDANDFIVRFPAGATLAAGGAVVVAIDGAGFLTTYGQRADFEVAGTDALTPDMVAVDVGATRSLLNGGEVVVLFAWDGASDLVQDLDLVHAGTPAAGDALAAKTGLAVDGPDADALTSTYAADAASLPIQANDPASGLSTKRVRLEGASETRGGAGNGATGDDETSEAIGATWDGGAPGGPAAAFTAPNPGIVSFPILTWQDDAPPPVTPLAPGSANHVIAAVRAGAGAASAVRIDDLALRDLGTGNPAAIAAVSVWQDTVRDGALDPTRDLRVGQATFAQAQAGLLTIALGQGLGVTVAAGTTERFFVTYDIAAQAALAQGQTFQARIEDAATAPEAALIGLPIASAIHNALPEVRLASNQPPDRTTDRTQTGVVIADLDASVTSGQAILVHVEATASGTGDASVEVASASLILDADRSGSISPGDTVLDVQGFPIAGGTVTFDANRTIFAGQPLRLLVTYAMSSALVHGSVFEVEIDVPAVGGVLGATLAGVPIAPADNATITADLDPTLVVTSLNPPSRAVTGGSAGLVVAAFAFTAQNAPVGVSDLDADAAGTGDDEGEVAAVRLVRDANASGAFEPLADTVLEVRSYGADDGTISFDFGGAPVFVSPGGAPERFFVVYDLDVGIPEGATFRLTLDNVATTARTVTGLPIASAEIRVQTPPTAAGRRGGGGGGGGGCAIAAASGPGAGSAGSAGAAGSPGSAGAGVVGWLGLLAAGLGVVRSRRRLAAR